MPHESILIIDDNQDTQYLLKSLLSTEGYDIRTATDAPEALEVLAEFQPALIIIPGMDGLSLTRKLLKNNIKLKDTIILAFTAYDTWGDEEIALSAGCNGYITKPIDPQKFTALIADYLMKRGPK